MRLSLLRLSLFLLVLLIGCTYAPDPDLIYFKDIEFNQNPEIRLSLNSFDDSPTIDIYGPTTFYYNYESDFGRIDQLVVSVGNNILLTTASTSGSFTVRDNLLVTGTYELKIQVLVDSNTGSIANKLDLEKFVVWRTWQLIVDVTPPPQPQITFSEENGHFKLSWTGYTKPGFVHYLVTVYSPFMSREFRITDPKTTSLPITDYVGGYSIECRVTLVTSMHYVQSQTIYRNDRIELTGEYRFSDSTMLLNWDRADFPGAFLSYTILENGGEKQTIYNIQDTTVRLQPSAIIFGESVTFQVMINVANGFSPGSNTLVQEKLLDIPILSPMPNYFTYNKTLQSIFGYFYNISPSQATKYSNELVPQQTITSGSFSFATPYESPYMYITDFEHGIVQVNLETQERKYINILPWTWGIFYDVYVASASRTQIVTFGYRAHDAAGNSIVQHVRVYDMVNQVTLYHAEFASGGNELIPIISEDGQYLRRVYNQFYKINGTNLQFVGLPVSTYGFLGFRPDASNEFMLIFNNVINIYNSANINLLRTINPPALFYECRGYDPVTKQVLYAKNGAKICYLIHVETGVVTPVQAFANDVTQLFFINGYLLYRASPYEGTYIKVIND